MLTKEWTSQIYPIAIIGLQWVEEVRPDRVVLCVDSSAALQSIQSWNSNRQDLLLHNKAYIGQGYLSNLAGFLPIGIEENEGADKTAKIATKTNNIIDKLFGEKKTEVKAI